MPTVPSKRGHWRSLTELRDPLHLGDDATPEFPEGADRPASDVSRRQFGRLLGASVALATGAGCSGGKPKKILPYVRQPPTVKSGVATTYATSMLLDGYATGLLVESHEGRPTKVEGNPEHPASLGAAGVFEQAHVLQLYDPDRASHPRRDTLPVGWRQVIDRLGAARADHGAALRLLIEPTSSPLVHRLVNDARKRLPEMRVTFHAPCGQRAPLDGAHLAFGHALAPQFDLRRAQAIVSLDADLLGTMPFRLRHARHFADRRREGTRLYVVEAMLSITGTMADNRLRRRGQDLPRLAAALALALGELPANLAAACAHAAVGGDEPDKTWAQAVAADLRGRPRGTTLIVVGERQPAALHALGYALNERLGNIGDATTASAAPLVFTATAIPEPRLDGAEQDLAALAADVRSGGVDTLITIGGNPVYDAPVDLDWAEVLHLVPDSVYAGLYENETARASRWFMPVSHGLESWGDGRAYDGTLSLQQPLIRPLHSSRSVPELLAALGGIRQPDGLTLLRASWPANLDWETALGRGFVASTAEHPAQARLDANAIALATEGLARPAGAGEGAAALEIGFYLSPTVHDGCFANNAWLQELPTPVGKLTWDNAALLAPATAQQLGVGDGDRLQVMASGRSIEVPALIIPGHAADSLSLWLGYGREGAERLASGVGASAYRLRTGGAPWFTAGKAVKIAGRHELALTQKHWTVQGRPIALATTRMAWRRDQTLTEAHKGTEASFFGPPKRTPALRLADPDAGPQWAMSIDTSVCIGCNACMVACQAENNVLVVGKAGVLVSREMHWLRIDTYFQGPAGDPTVVHQPMLCQHCEHAPCEYVCPVNATVHSPDGLNEMVYNRCVGTRFCSNNCPYKVRRFNWFDWSERQGANQGVVKLQRNPDVTVRERGVMEKCSYCVQRIRRAEITARKQQREIARDEVVTACQQACPTRAIVFGSLNDEASRVGALRFDRRSYEVLHELGTRPRTTYLLRLDDPNPELA
ncbi:MAG TPA: TAT-variant-translocated molybdopterin oxidoreductase [Polyangia bacterium]|jgi:molybdopterin-containing oxidoreductase family iron-sulfur binding subunit